MNNKDKALKNAQELISDIIIKNNMNYNLNEPINLCLGENYLKYDPELKILESELIKVNFQITKDNGYEHMYILSKIK